MTFELYKSDHSEIKFATVWKHDVSAVRKVVFVAYFSDFGLVGDSAQPKAY